MNSSLAALPDVKPRFLTSPPSVTTEAATEAVELAASAGLVLDPWQVDALHVCLGERADGKWSARQFGLIVPRQNGKGAILEAIELAALFLFGERLIMHSAHEFKTAAEAFLRVKALIQNTPDLHKRVAHNGYHNAHGNEGITLKDGARLKFVARTGGSGRGFSGDRIILDEAYNLSDRGVSALAPAMAARPNPQALFTSSAPLEEESSAVLRRLCKRGRSGDQSLAYVEYCADDDADLDDRDAWAQANPGYPHRIDDDAIEAERGLMLPDDFARERLGIVNLEESATEWVIPAADWLACADKTSAMPPKERPSFGLEVAEDRSWSTFCAAGPSTAGFIHLEIVANEQGTQWVTERAKALHDRWHGSIAVRKGSPAAALIADLKSAGVPVEEINTEDYARACGQFYDAAVGHRFRHRDEGALNKSVRKAVRKNRGDAYVWDQRKSSIDISPLVAVTLAAAQHLAPSEKRTPRAVWL